MWRWQLAKVLSKVRGGERSLPGVPQSDLYTHCIRYYRKWKAKNTLMDCLDVFQQVFGIADLAYSKGSGRNLEHRPEDTFGINYERPGYGFLWFCDVRSGKCCFKKNRSGNKSENSFISIKKCCHNFSDLVKCIYWQCHHLPLVLRE